jgi:type IV pilus assembly protein PilV
MRSQASGSAGFTLVEALVAMLVFSMGVLALVGMYSASVRATRDAQFRIEATHYAGEILQTISAEVARPGGKVDPIDLMTFGLNTGGSACGAFNGGQVDASRVALANWLARLAAATGLPGAGGTGQQQVLVNTGNFNQVIVTVCWQAPGDTQPHSHQVIGNVN